MLEGFGSAYMDHSILYTIAVQHINFFLSFISLSTMAAVIIAAIRVYGRAFLLMTISWNSVNLLIAYWLGIHVESYETVTIEWLHAHLILLFWINIGLDLIYVVCALFYKKELNENSTNNYAIKLGFIYAIVVQGAGMLLIDLITLFRLHI